VAKIGTRISCWNTSQNTASQNGSSQGSATEATTISIADNPL